MPSATRLTASTFGVLAGLGGIRHGIGEVQQGAASPRGIFIESWTEGPIAEHMGGEPGITIVPNMLATGILALVVSSLVVVWAAFFVQRRRGGLVLSLLSVAMLLVGGGVGPPIVGMLAGWPGSASIGGWRGRLSRRAVRLLAAAWPWVYAVATVNGVFLFVASFVLVFAFDFDDAGLMLGSFYYAVVLLVLTTLCAIAHEVRRSSVAREAGTAPSPLEATEAGSAPPGGSLRRRVTMGLAVALACALVAPVAMLALSLRTYSFGNPRSRLNGYLMTHTATVRAGPEAVFDFITYRMAEHNLSIAKAHEKFEIVDGEGLTVGSRFIVEEWADEEGVRNEYVVREVAPNRMIHMASTPSRILRRDGAGRVEETGTANAYVYFDLEPAPTGTRLTQTVVIEMPGFIVKSLVDLIVLFEDENPWQEHLVEELEGLKTAIETAGAGPVDRGLVR